MLPGFLDVQRGGPMPVQGDCPQVDEVLMVLPVQLLRLEQLLCQIQTPPHVYCPLAVH